MCKLNIDAAFKAAREKGYKVTKTELGRILWPETTETNTVRINMTYLVSGRTKRITPKQIKKMCEYLHCTADFLLSGC